MASRLMPICGHLRTLGEERVVHLCIRQRDHQQDDGTNHLMVPFHQYVRDRAERAEGGELEARPWWLETLAEAVQEMNRQAFREALSEDPTQPEGRPPYPDESDPDHVKSDKWRAIEEWHRRHPQGGQCPETMVEGGDLLRCARQAGHNTSIHPHGPWMKVGEVPPSADGPVPGSRSQGETWQQVTQDDPDAWKAPDDGERATEPPAGDVPEADLGWSVTGRGKQPGQVDHIDIKIPTPPSGAGAGGTGVSSVAEVKAAARGIMDKIQEARGMMEAAKSILADQGAYATQVLGDSSQETAQAVLSGTNAAEGQLDEALSASGMAVENLEQFIARA